LSRIGQPQWGKGYFLFRGYKELALTGQNKYVYKPNRRDFDGRYFNGRCPSLTYTTLSGLPNKMKSLGNS